MKSKLATFDQNKNQREVLNKQVGDLVEQLNIMADSNKELEKQISTKAHEIEDLRQQMTATELKHASVETDNESLM